MGRPKALLPLAGATFLDRIAGLLGRVCEPVVVVLGYHADLIRAGARSQYVAVVNAEPERGMLSSLQCGLRALPARVPGFAFTPVDYPAVSAETVDRLAAAFAGRAPGMELVVPRCQGRRGHPVFASGELIAEFLALPVGAAARDVVRAHESAIEYVETNDRGVIRDIDDPADYQELLEAYR